MREAPRSGGRSDRGGRSDQRGGGVTSGDRGEGAGVRVPLHSHARYAALAVLLRPPGDTDSDKRSAVNVHLMIFAFVPRGIYAHVV